MTQNQKDSNKGKNNRCLTSGGLLTWDVETPTEWLAIGGNEEGILSSDSLLTERILGDEALDIVTPSTTSSAPKNPLSQGIVCCKDGCFCAISLHVIM